MKTLFAAAVGLAMIAAPLAASAEPYGGWGGGDRGYGGYRGGDRHWDGDRRWDGDHRWDRDRDRDRGHGDAAAAGALGLILGAALAGNSYGHPGYERCVWRTQAYETRWGRTEYRQVQVCR